MSEKKNYTIEEIKEIYNTGILELILRAVGVHEKHHGYKKIHLNTLLSYKTGGCTEDCVFCAQSSHYRTHIESGSKYLTIDEATEQARKAKDNGSERICISASWKNIPDNEKFEQILEIGKIIQQMGLNVCCTLGSVTADQIKKLKDAGFSAYNHNIETSENYFSRIVTTHSYSDRKEVIKLLQENDMPWCSGGIIGLGESENDRYEMLMFLTNQPKHPFSVPLNIHTPIPGTPLENSKPIDEWEMLRMIATARILMPESIICLAAGRQNMNTAMQTLCILSGANSVFTGEKLLTIENCSIQDDNELISMLGLNQKN